MAKKRNNAGSTSLTLLLLLSAFGCGASQTYHPEVLPPIPLSEDLLPGTPVLKGDLNTYHKKVTLHDNDHPIITQYVPPPEDPVSKPSPGSPRPQVAAGLVKDTAEGQVNVSQNVATNKVSILSPQIEQGEKYEGTSETAEQAQEYAAPSDQPTKHENMEGRGTSRTPGRRR